MYESSQPTMYMIAGPNGAGKSTLYNTVINQKVKAPFINADLIQKSELTDQSVEGAYKAAKIAEERRQDHLENKKDFVSESTFSHPSKVDLIDQAKEAGFRVILYHVNVRSPDISVSRVEQRVSKGGHDVPEEKIRGRYERNQGLIKEAISKCDLAFVYDNSTMNKAPSLAIGFKNGIVEGVSNNVPRWARELYKNQLKHFSISRLNPAAASYQDAKKIANGIHGNETTVSIPKQGREYQGKIVGETTLHFLQHNEQTGKFTAHFKTRLNKAVHIGDQVTISQQSKNLGIVSAMMPEQEKSKLPQETKEIIDSLAQKLKNNPNLDAKQQKNILDAVEQKAIQLTKANTKPNEKMLNVLAEKQIKNELNKTQEKNIGRDV